MHVSKRFGVEPPGLIKLEKEIEQEETLSAPLPSPSPSPTKSPGKKSTGKLLDDAVSCGRKLLPIWPILVCTYLQSTQKPEFNISLYFKDLQTDRVNLFLTTIIYVWSLEKMSHCVGDLQFSLALCLGPSSLLITPFSFSVHFLFINSHLVFCLRKDWVRTRRFGPYWLVFVNNLCFWVISA